eukprot:6003105-Prymnesium_polylepis.1
MRKQREGSDSGTRSERRASSIRAHQRRVNGPSSSREYRARDSSGHPLGRGWVGSIIADPPSRGSRGRRGAKGEPWVRG